MAPTAISPTPPVGHAPPAYNDNTTSTTYDEDSLTQQLTNLKLNDLVSPTEFPTPGQTIAHLELLVAFSHLRDEIRSHDGLFDLWNNDATSKISIEDIQEKRWAVFVTTAVDRFSAWWKALAVMADGPRLTVLDTTKALRPTYLEKYRRSAGKWMVQNKDELPPLGTA